MFDSPRFEPGGPTLKECHDGMGAEQLEALFGTSSRNFCCTDANDPNRRCGCSARDGAWYNITKVIMLVKPMMMVLLVFGEEVIFIDPNDFYQEFNRVQIPRIQSSPNIY